MLLSSLIAEVRERPALAGLRVTTNDDPDLLRAVQDSRSVEPNTLFCCVPGAIHDGHDHAPAAVRAGAAALLVERPLDLGVPELVVPSVRRAMGPISAALLGHPSRALTLVGVTGTNGKTTTVHLLDAILRADGRRATSIGTLTGARTTPEAPDLQARLADAVRAGVDSVAMEVSSHAIDQHRIDGTEFDLVVFTNLSQDHLDYHGDMATYFRAKAALFAPEHARRGIVDRDDPHGRLLGDVAEIDCITFGLDDVDDLVLEATGSTFTWRGTPMRITLPGRFNVSNALAAATAAAELGIGTDVIAHGLAGVGPVAGRFERIDVGQGFLAAVDYAHTPDGLAQLLTTARELTDDGRVLIVFGAGGDRDRSKRPHMGEVASRLADTMILTTDNPRHEDPHDILEQIRSGIGGSASVHVELDRRAAIRHAVAVARPGDVVLVAGKGHETTQTTGDSIEHLDDREELRAALLTQMENQT